MHPPSIPFLRTPSSLLAAAALAFSAPLLAAGEPTRETSNSFASPASTQAPAQADEGDTPRTVVEEEVDVDGEAPEIPALSGISARLPMDPIDTPASFSQVGHPVLTEQTALTLSDALINLPGVNVQTGSGTFDDFWVRGFEAVSGALVLVDGALDPESTFLHLYNVDRVELVRGAAGGFLYGGRSLAGTFNLVRKRPAKENFTHLHAVGGSHGYWQTTVDSNWQLSPNSGLRVNGMWHTADNFRDDNESDAWAINPTFRWNNERTSFGASLEFVSNEFTPDGGLPIVGGAIPNIDRQRSFDSANDFQTQDVVRLSFDVEHQLTDTWELRAQAFYSDLDWQTSGTVFASAFATGPGSALAIPTQTDLDDRQTFFGLKAELATQVELGATSHELIFGTELDRLDDDFDLRIGLRSPVEIFSGTVFGPPGVVAPIPSQSRFGDVSTDVLAAYVFDRISFSDRFQLVLGARWDSIELDGDGTAQSRDDDQVSPFVGIVVRPAERLSLYANYAESFEPQSTLAVGEVKPEEGEQVEVGIKHESRGGQVQTTLAWFRLEKENIGIVDQTGFPSQVGSQESQGVELEIVAHLPGELDLRFGYAYTDAELTEFRELVFFGTGPFDFLILDHSGNQAPFAPEHLANLWLTRRFGNGWGIGFGGRYIDEQPIGPDNSFSIDAVTLLDAALFFNWNRTQLNFNLFNLTDEDYETRSRGTSAVTPASGLEARAGIRWLF